MCCQFGKRRAPKNPKESSNEISKIMDMKPRSIKKHEWNVANMVPISITKHNMFFGIWGILGSSGINILENVGQQQ